MKLEAKLKENIKNLEKEELRLFHSYNRHAQAGVKLNVLSEITKVIIQIEALKKINS